MASGNEVVVSAIQITAVDGEIELLDGEPDPAKSQKLDTRSRFAEGLCCSVRANSMLPVAHSRTA